MPDGRLLAGEIIGEIRSRSGFDNGPDVEGSRGRGGGEKESSDEIDSMDGKRVSKLISPSGIDDAGSGVLLG